MKKNIKYFFFLLIGFGIFHTGNLYSYTPTSQSNASISPTKLSDQSLHQNNPCFSAVTNYENILFEEDKDVQDTKHKTNLNTTFVLLFLLGEKNSNRIRKPFAERFFLPILTSKIFILNSVFRL